MGVLTRYLLDTHTLLWLTAQPELLPRPVRDVIVEGDGVVLVSAVSAFEIALKNRTGKLPGVENLVETFEQVISDAGFHHLEITFRHAVAAGRLDLRHKDPFDRLLIGQALVEDLVLLSNEWRFDAFGVRRLW